tara:strand:- start:339 stop:674 length:336 start_codon:yes stop_codon:yes gene_type:complete
MFKPVCLENTEQSGTTIIDNKVIAKSRREGFAHCARGFLIPCCLLDGAHNDFDPMYTALFKDDLKLSNNESIEDILLSDEWIAFGKAVIKGVHEGIEHAPLSCQKTCGNTK